MAHRDEIVRWANELLDVHKIPEYGVPGLQVVGADEVEKIAVGVSSTRELFERAAEIGAQLVLVHHGLFWKNEPLIVDRRIKGRLEALFAANMSLVAYHLALDGHPEIGNNVLLTQLLGARRDGAFEELGASAAFDEPVGVDELARRLEDATGRAPVVFDGGPAEIRRVAVVTGGGGYLLIKAAHEGFDALVTGEPEEPALATARELGIHFLAGGHYATETFGVRALADRLAERFGVSTEFIPVENPV